MTAVLSVAGRHAEPAVVGRHAAAKAVGRHAAGPAMDAPEPDAAEATATSRLVGVKEPLLEPPRVSAPRTAARADARPLFFPAVDGLRGLAVASVLVFATGWSSRGLFGVDVLFVVSGFLVTLMLLRELHRTGRVRIAAFYVRRIKRIAPALPLVLTATLGAVWLWGTSQELRLTAPKAVAALGQFANWQEIAAGQDPLADPGRIEPLAHLWALSITEQVCLVLPFVVLVVWFIARRRPAVASGCLLVLALGSGLVGPLLWDGTNGDRLRLGTEMRAVGLLAGAALAAMVFTVGTRRGRRLRDDRTRTFTTVWVTATSALTLASVVVVSALTTSYQEPWLYQGGFAAVAFAAAVLTATLCSPANLVARFFSFSLLTWFGRMAYTLYLVHLPVYWGVRAFAPECGPIHLLVFGGGLTVLLSVLLHHLLTEPLRKKRWPAWKAVPALLGATALLLTMASVAPARTAAQALSTTPVVSDADRGWRLSPGRAGGRPLVMTLGDSLAVDLASVLSEHGTGSFAVADAGRSGCGLFDPDGKVRSSVSREWTAQDDCPEPVAWTVTNVRTHAPDIVVVHASWDATEQYLDGVWLAPGDPEWAERYTAQLDAVIDAVENNAPGALVILATDRPTNGVVTDPGPLAEYNAFVKAVADHRDVPVLDVGARLVGGAGVGGDRALVDKDGRAIFQDDDVHLSVAGKQYLSGWLENALGYWYNRHVDASAER